ncbi:VanZ family protein [Allosaccharopolyspora coralli]|uniref:VanZ family protein n=1 Tax=Allosaccharopolyspora coralli TaxID=2665642 RepID=UPI001C9E9450|nr:VanZ family protein [Allosaccharopolyspora coralli]
MVILFTPASGVPSAPPGTDVIVHLTLFAALAGTGALARLPPRPLTLGLALYAGASEVLQMLLPLGRSGDPVDVLADLAGVALGLTAAVWAPRVRAATSRSVLSD